MTDERPRPLPDETSRFYWDAAGSGRLMLQCCRSCRQLQFPPDVCCVHCQSEDYEHVEVSGHGSVYSYAIIDRPLHRGFIDAVPYVIALIELAEQPGLRLLTNIVDTPPEQIVCGMPVTVTFEDRADITMPQFRAAANS